MLAIGETISIFLKIQNWPNSFFQKSRSEKNPFFENFPSKIIVNKLWTAVLETSSRSPKKIFFFLLVAIHKLCLLLEKIVTDKFSGLRKLCLCCNTSYACYEQATDKKTAGAVAPAMLAIRKITPQGVWESPNLRSREQPNTFCRPCRNDKTGIG